MKRPTSDYPCSAANLDKALKITIEGSSLNFRDSVVTLYQINGLGLAPKIALGTKVDMFLSLIESRQNLTKKKIENLNIANPSGHPKLVRMIL